MRQLRWRPLLLCLLLSGCTALQGEVLQERPPAPDFGLQTTAGDRCVLSDHRGQVVGIYMTNL